MHVLSEYAALHIKRKFFFREKLIHRWPEPYERSKNDDFAASKHPRRSLTGTYVWCRIGISYSFTKTHYFKNFGSNPQIIILTLAITI